MGYFEVEVGALEEEAGGGEFDAADLAQGEEVLGLLVGQALELHRVKRVMIILEEAVGYYNGWECSYGF